MKVKVCAALSLSLVIILLSSCAGRVASVKYPTKIPKTKTVELMGYTIQAGAFANVENAARLTGLLRQRGLDSTYFKAADGLYKVRFGNYFSKEAAAKMALSLKDRGVIEEYYIIIPEDYAAAKQKQLGSDYIRESLVRTARDFIGVPYLWGGASLERGFDCSGLTMTVYQLNGLNLPRSSARQFDAGTPVDNTEELRKGDLVFFALTQKDRVSHVGVYIGNGDFIHASSQGKTIRIDSLHTPYYSRGFVGGRSYF